MYLTENTPEAQEMRQKVRDMLVSEYEPNVGLAFAILQTGGFHLELFPYIWSAYCSKKYDLKEYEDTFQAMIVALFPEKLHEYIQYEASRMRAYYWRSPYNLFNNTAFFELLVSENMTTLSALLGYWEREPFYKKHTCLTRFLLENKVFLTP
jgi:hypothetical protein